METINSISIDIAVELGATKMPVHQLLRMGRGAVIELETKEDDDLVLMANNTPIARGQVMLQGDKILISVIELLPRPPEKRGGGGLRTFGGSSQELADMSEAPEILDRQDEELVAPLAADADLTPQPLG
ncbi:MAG: FliM/FliN family flagellar motor switch protein [Pseudomonadota bacterium]